MSLISKFIIFTSKAVLNSEIDSAQSEYSSNTHYSRLFSEYEILFGKSPEHTEYVITTQVPGILYHNNGNFVLFTRKPLYFLKCIKFRKKRISTSHSNVNHRAMSHVFNLNDYKYSFYVDLWSLNSHIRKNGILMKNRMRNTYIFVKYSNNTYDCNHGILFVIRSILVQIKCRYRPIVK